MLAYLEKLNMLATPVWMVAPESEMLIFSNLQAQFLSGGASLAAMREGECSAVAHRKLTGYATSLKTGMILLRSGLSPLRTEPVR